jgi:hypothetical protein
MKILSLSEAKSIGSNTYYTGVPCKHGHDTYRYTSDRICSDCAKLKVKKLSTIGGGNARRWAAKTEEEKKIINEKRKVYYQKTKETRLLEKKRYWLKAKDTAEYKQKVKEYGSEWKQSNKGKVNSYTAKRRIAKLNRTPKWLTAVDFERIENEYKLAAILTKLWGEPWHVDHVIPLQGKMVSGLHVPSNLQVLRGKDNIKKANGYLPK